MGISLDEAMQVFAAAREIASAEDAAMTFALVDEGGHLVALVRMDDAPWATVEVAIGKAWTAAAWRQESAQQGAKARDLPQFANAMSAMTGGRYTPQDGGVPVIVDGRVVGGIGASGSTGQHDADVVRRALDRVLA
jgi:uncharacterized protein GlcG (DUF336 family)